MAYRNIRKEWRNLGSPLSWRLICKKSYAAFSNDDLEKLNGLTLHSVKLTHWCPPPGIPLSAVRMLVSKGPSVEVKKLVPSLVPFLKASAVDGFQGSGPKHKAFEVLEKALLTLTNPSNEHGLSSKVMGVLDNQLIKKKDATKENKTITEEVVNVAIVEQILQHLTSGFFILNKGHSKVKQHPKRLYMPDTFGLTGLALGHKTAWYGELDMLACPYSDGLALTGHYKSTVAFLFEKFDVDDQDSEDEEEDDFEEGFSSEGSVAVEDKKFVPDTWSIFSSRFSQGYATAVTFSYVYRYALSGTQSACSSLVPTIQTSSQGYQIFIYDCIEDVMLANNFVWSRESIIYLWAFLHHHLFFPPVVDVKLANDIPKFGYDKSAGFYANRSNLLFGLSLNSQHWKEVDPEEGRMLRPR